MRYLLAADTGGTFTDLAAFDRARGRLVCVKSLTTYDDLVAGVMDCVAKAGIDLADTEVVKFGTTLVINTFVQRNGARIALVTTRGHRDILEIRRGNRAEPFDLRYEREPVLVERDRRFEVGERIGAEGAVVRPLDAAELADTVKLLVALEVEAVAVSLLNAYANPAHESEVARVLRAALPGVYIAVGSELSREWYEYERTSTAVANAYVGPRMQDYLGRLDRRLRADGFGRAFYMMASNGGVFAVERAQAQPVALLESGPVGGAIGAGAYAEALGLARVIAFDMGGTTAKCAVVEDGRFQVRSPYYVGGESRGFPVRHAVLDIVEVGAGGGSIAWLDREERLCVGPRSAGSMPGPACYGRGGTEPTMTDANLVLGRIGAHSFLGGDMALDAAAARDAIGRLAATLGMESPHALDETAQGILSLGAMTMADAIKRITIERGLDPREFALVAFGGGGPLHGAALAREMGIPEMIVPPEPGNFSALGMILADARVDETRTVLAPLAADRIAPMRAAFEEIEAGLRDTLGRELPGAAIALDRFVEMRFRGQRHVVRTPVTAARDVETIRAAFEASYRQRYGFVDAIAPAEMVALVVTAVARFERPELALLAPRRAAGAAERGTREVWFAEAGARLTTPVLDRYALAPGFAAPGPVLVEEYGSTTVVGPRDRLIVGALGELRVRIE